MEAEVLHQRHDEKQGKHGSQQQWRQQEKAGDKRRPTQVFAEEEQKSSLVEDRLQSN